MQTAKEHSAYVRAGFYIIIFLLGFNYFTLKNSKDTVVLASSKSGAEMITFIKVFLVVPCSLLSSMAYPFLIRISSPSSAMFFFTIPLLLYFMLFILILYPNTNQISAYKAAEFSTHFIPERWVAVPEMIKLWHVSLFYVFSELWGTLVLAIGFWGFTNSVTRFREAKILYGKLLATYNISGIVSGVAGIFITGMQYKRSFPLGTTSWEQNINKIVILVFISGTIACIIFAILSRLANIKEKSDSIKYEVQEKNSNGNILSTLTSSKTIAALSIMSIAFGATATIPEMIWKFLLKKNSPSPDIYSAHFHTVGMLSSAFAVILGWSSRRILHRLNLHSTAYLIAIICGGATALFLITTLFAEIICPNKSLLRIAIFLGSFHSFIIRSFKNSLFDIVKDLAMILLNHETKAKGKALVDGLMSRTGKLMAGFLFMFCLPIFGSLPGCTHVAIVVEFFVIFSWFLAIKNIKDVEEL